MKNLAVKIRLLEFATEIQASPDFCTCTTLQYVNRFFCPHTSIHYGPRADKNGKFCVSDITVLASYRHGMTAPVT